MEEGLSLETETEGAVELQRTEEWLERCWWSIVAVVLILSLTGIFGKGYLSNTQSFSPDESVKVEYEWITRYRSELDLTISMKESSKEGEIVCEFEHAFLNALIPRTFTPPPAKVISDGAHLRYLFSVTPGKPNSISAQLEAVTWGRVNGSLRCGDADAIPLSIFILP